MSLSQLAAEAESKRVGDKPDWLVHLNEKGWAVIKNVFSKNECKAAFEGILSEVKQVFGTEAKNKNDFPPGLHGGLMQSSGIGHLQSVWNVRTHPEVAKIFATIWNTDELWTSMDALNITFPSKIGVDKPWHHIDQSPNKGGFCCVQGFVNLLDCTNEEDGGLEVLEGSHKLHESFFKKFPDIKADGDWYKFNDYKPERFEFFASKCKPVKVAVEAGDFVIWDSRTIHHARKPTPASKRIRSVVYVSMLPAAWGSDKDVENRKKAITERRSTTHWSVGVKLFPSTFRYSTANEKKKFDSKKIPEPKLTDRQKRLAGLMPY